MVFTVLNVATKTLSDVTAIVDEKVKAKQDIKTALGKIPYTVRSDGLIYFDRQLTAAEKTALITELNK